MPDPISAPVSLPPPDQIRRLANEILSRRDYSHADLTAPEDSWLVRMFNQLTEYLNGIHERQPSLYYLILIVAICLLVGLIWHLVYTFRTALGRNSNTANKAPGDTTSGADDPAIYELKAKNAARAGDFTVAVRMLMISGLAALEHARKGRLRKGLTNREYLERYAKTPAREPLAQFVLLLDDRWFSGGFCIESDYQSLLPRHAEILSAATVIQREREHREKAQNTAATPNKRGLA